MNVSRVNTIEKLNVQRYHKEGTIENKFTPLFSSVEPNVKSAVIVRPQNEHDFLYKNFAGYKHSIDLGVNLENSEKRQKALNKLYHNYKNKATFKKN